MELKMYLISFNLIIVLSYRLSLLFSKLSLNTYCCFQHGCCLIKIVNTVIFSLLVRIFSLILRLNVPSS